MPRESTVAEVDDEFPEDKPAMEAVATPGAPGTAIADIVRIKERGWLDATISSQAFWVTVALVVICGGMSWLAPAAFATTENFFNITRNFAFIGIMALGMTMVIITGGIDLSVGSVMGVVAIAAGLVLQAGYSGVLAMFAGLATGLVAGTINGALIAYAGLSPFIVTLGMLSMARSAAIVLSQNKMIYELGPDAQTVYAIGGGAVFGVSNPVWVMLILTVAFGFLLRMTAWGRYVFAIGGNESAARLTGVPVAYVKLQCYIICSLTAAVSALMILGWQGSAINALGVGYELRVIASTVIGGANLIGGEGGAYGAVIGSALIEVIRNSLLMAGIDSNWQGMFVGVVLILAVYLEKIRGRKRA
jgi:ribose transport system permease protein